MKEHVGKSWCWYIKDGGDFLVVYADGSFSLSTDEGSLDFDDAPEFLEHMGTQKVVRRERLM